MAEGKTELEQIKAALSNYDRAILRELRRELKDDHFILELHREHPALKDCACTIAAEWRGLASIPKSQSKCHPPQADVND